MTRTFPAEVIPADTRLQGVAYVPGIEMLAGELRATGLRPGVDQWLYLTRNGDTVARFEITQVLLPGDTYTLTCFGHQWVIPVEEES